MEETRGTRKLRLPPLSRHITQHLNVLTNPEASRTPPFSGSYGGFITESWLIKSLATGDSSQSAPWKLGDGAKSFNALIMA